MPAGSHGTATAPDEASLVAAARTGDRQALDSLITAYLPLIYNIVHRAVGRPADVDDVVQEIMLRAVRDLRMLREPKSFRPWLVSIAFHQIGTYQHGRRQAEQHAAIGDLARSTAAAADVEDLALLRMDVSDQRRQVVEAAGWLDSDNRALLALWWQEIGGALTRAEVSQAAGSTVAHTGVRLQRMREQMELGRQIAAALSARPRCAALDAVAQDWDGSLTSLWRKRLGRHVTDCPTCAAAGSGLIALERLLFTFAAIPVPVGLAVLVAKGLVWTPAAALGAHASVVGKLAQTLTAHPLATLATGAVLVAAPAVTYATWPHPKAPSVVVAAPSPRPPLSSAAPSRSPAVKPSAARPSPTAAAGLELGAVSLEAVGTPGQFLSYAASVYAEVGPVSGAPQRQRATFTVVQGLADARCYTLRAADGRYLRHYYLRLRLSPAEDTQLFREDATFCVKPGSVAGSITLQSHNYPGSVLRMRDGGVYLDGSDGTKEFARDSSFIRRQPWTG